MLKVVIVDDEPFIRFGIKASIQWEEEGFLVTGEFANGAEALNHLKLEPADILITDIKMPVMDGLELVREAARIRPHMKSILVSSHNDFDYVREGLKLGVVDYILKHTLEPDELLQMMRNCKKLIAEEEHLRDKLENAQGAEFARLRKSYEQELKRYLTDKTDHLLRDNYPDWMDKTYTAVYAALNRVHALEEMYGFLHKSIVLDQIMDEFYVQSPQGIALTTAENELFFLMPGKQSEEQLYSIRSGMERESGANVTIGYVSGTGTADIKASFSQSKKACARGFFEGEGVIPYRNEQRIDRAGPCLPEMIPTLPYLSDEQLEQIVTAWKSEWSGGGIAPFALKEQASRVLSNMYKHSVDPHMLVESFDRIFKTENMDELCATLLEQIAELRKHSSGTMETKRADNPVGKALEYIRSHYTESLTLQQVADTVHLNKNYFSILFKKTTGQNFIDYVIHLRVEKAKTLLAGTELKIYEVAEQSGFNDVKYFSKLFKKLSSVSPVEYRENRHSS